MPFKAVNNPTPPMTCSFCGDGRSYPPWRIGGHYGCHDCFNRYVDAKNAASANVLRAFLSERDLRLAMDADAPTLSTTPTNDPA